MINPAIFYFGNIDLGRSVVKYEIMVTVHRFGFQKFKIDSLSKSGEVRELETLKVVVSEVVNGGPPPGGPSFLLHHAIILEFLVQGLAGDPQSSGSLALISAGEFKCLQYGPLFNLL